MYESFWAIVTLFGDPTLSSSLVIGLTAVYFLLGRRKPMGEAPAKYRRLLKKFLLLIIPSLFIAFLGTEALKLLFQVPRPCIPCPAPGCSLYCPFTFSFPSGHTATITGIVTALFLLLRKKKHALLYCLPVLVAASRVALGVHTIADVIGGFVFGLFSTLVVYKFRKRLYKWEDEIL
jgi:membrane-associated phospholipid phosphatase